MTDRDIAPPGGDIAPDNDLPPWRWREFHEAMKAAGWQRISTSNPTRTYRHPDTGAFFYPFDWTAARGCQAWREWAAKREVPSP